MRENHIHDYLQQESSRQDYYGFIIDEDVQDDSMISGSPTLPVGRLLRKNI